ncbi:MAG: methionyl-tRNA formyltransferase [Planctomycetota bacterium]
MRLLYFGSGAFGLPTLQRLHAGSEHQVVAVVSQPDRPAGRKRALTPTPIAAWAEAQNIETLKSDDVNTPSFVAKVSGYAADASVVIAFGQKLTPELIAAIGRLAVNVHSSLLPKFRGAAPINWAMIENEPVTGVSVIGLAQRMDAGAVYATAETPIDPRETAGELHDRLAELGPDCVLRVLDDLQNDRLTPMTQDDTQATRAPKFTKADGTVWFDRSAALVRARVHGLTPWPGCRVAWTSAASGTTETLILKRVIDHPPDKVDADSGVVRPDLRVVCGPGSIELLELQAPGGKPLPLGEFVKGRPLRPGDVLSAVGA